MEVKRSWNTLEKPFQVILLIHMTLNQIANFNWLWVHPFIPPIPPAMLHPKLILFTPILLTLQRCLGREG